MDYSSKTKFSQVLGTNRFKIAKDPDDCGYLEDFGEIEHF